MAKFTRRDVLIGGAAALATTTLPGVALSRSITDSLSLNDTNGDDSMATITTKDGTTTFYKDWGPKNAQPIVFHHGWPLSSEDWDAQMLFFLGNGYRVIAHDRRGHGRS
jgi:non-heme chloroperoxidase